MEQKKRLKKQILIGVVGIAATAITSIITYKIYKQWTSDKEELAGPKPSNKESGNFSDMSKAGSLHEYLEELTNKYGRIGAFWWGKTRVAYITSQKILLDEENKKAFKNLSDRPPFLFDGFKPLIGKHSIQYANGPEFRARYHNVWLAAFQRGIVNKIPIIATITQQIVNEWTKLIDENDEKKPVIIDMMHSGYKFASKSTAYASFGSNINEETLSNIVKGYEIAWSEMETRLIDGIPSDAERDKQFEKALNQIKNGVRSILSNSKPSKNSFLDIILNQKSLYDTEDKIFDEAITAIVGGTHTTGTGITWLFNYIARNEKVQQKMFNEIAKYFDINNNINEMNAQMICDKLKRLMYCKQVITETLRISSLAPWAARVNYEKDIILNKCDGSGQKVKIPKGMAWIIGQGVALNDNSVFQNPYKFDPERWSRTNLKQSKILQQSQDSIFGGIGARMCPGWSFFRTEALIFIVGVVTKFKFAMVDETKIETKYGLVASPKQKIEIKVIKRGSYNSTKQLQSMNE